MITRIKSNKGSLTVEASILFPVIFLCLLALLFMLFFLYEQAYVQSLADRACERGAEVWSNLKRDMYIGKVNYNDFEEKDPYWRLWDTHKEEKEKKVLAYIEKQLEKYSLLGDKSLQLSKGTPDVKIEATLKNYVVYKKLKVDVYKKFTLPVGGLLKNYGIGNVFTIKATSEAAVNDSAEFVRNTDFAMDVGREVDDATGGNAQKVIEKVTNFLGKIKTKADNAVTDKEPEEKETTE